MKAKKDMTLNELMAYYLEKSQVANGGRVTAAPGSQTTVFVETVGGEGYTEQVKARAWGELKSEPAILLKLFRDSHYALSHETYKEICSLLNRDLDGCEVTTTMYSQGAMPGSRIRITPEGRSTLDAVAWYEIPPGPLKLFQVDGKHYAISLVAPRTVSVTIVSQRRTGRFANPDSRREIIWYDLDLSGRGIAGFPRKPEYLL